MSKIWRSKNKALPVLSALLAAGLNSQSGFASTDIQDPEAVKRSVQDAIEAQLDHEDYSDFRVSVRSLDRRLRLAACDVPLTSTITNPSKNLGRVTTLVECNGEKNWKIYVQATASAEVLTPVLIRSLPRGSLISANDVELKSMSVTSRGQPVAESLDDVVGMELRRPVSAGDRILVSQIVAPDVIKRGQKVSILYAGNDLNISMSGKALQSAGAGDWIKVENLSSGRLVEGRVEKDGSILIPSF